MTARSKNTLCFSHGRTVEGFVVLSRRSTHDLFISFSTTVLQQNPCSLCARAGLRGFLIWKADSTRLYERKLRSLTFQTNRLLVRLKVPGNCTSFRGTLVNPTTNGSGLSWNRNSFLLLTRVRHNSSSPREQKHKGFGTKFRLATPSRDSGKDCEISGSNKLTRASKTACV